MGKGAPGRFGRSLGKANQIFSGIDAYISGSIDAGLFHISGKPATGVSLEDAEAAIYEQIELLQAELVGEEELEKVKNKFESTQIFGNINYLTVATNLAWFELHGKAEDINTEVEKYRAVTAEQLQAVAQKAFVPTNRVVLYYKKSSTEK